MTSDDLNELERLEADATSEERFGDGSDVGYLLFLRHHARDLIAAARERDKYRAALEAVANLTISDSRSTPVWVVIATEALRNGG